MKKFPELNFEWNNLPTGEFATNVSDLSFTSSEFVGPFWLDQPLKECDAFFLETRLGVSQVIWDWNIGQTVGVSCPKNNGVSCQDERKNNLSCSEGGITS